MATAKKEEMENSLYKGTPLKEMDREELIEAVYVLGNLYLEQLDERFINVGVDASKGFQNR